MYDFVIQLVKFSNKHSKPPRNKKLEGPCEGT